MYCCGWTSKHKQNGSIPPNGTSLSAVMMMSEEGDDSINRVPAWPRECCGRQRISVDSNISQVEDSLESIWFNLSACNTLEPPGVAICELQAGHICYGDR